MKAVSITICAHIDDDVDAKDFGDAVAKLIQTGKSKSIDVAVYEVAKAEPSDVECIEARDL